MIYKLLKSMMRFNHKISNKGANTMDLSAQISAIAPKDSGVLVTYHGDSRYTIFFPIPGLDPQSFIQNNFPNAGALTGLGAEIKEGKEYSSHTFILYEMPEIHCPTNYQLLGLTCLTKINNPDYKLCGKSIKDLPFEIAESIIAKDIIYAGKVSDQLELIKIMTHQNKTFQELEFYFEEIIKQYETWGELRKYLRGLKVEPTKSDSLKYLD